MSIELYDYDVFQCPWCNVDIIIYKYDRNCCIFRCGIYKRDYTPINPHMIKSECDKLKDSDLIYGCGKPLKLINNNLIKSEYL
jgi:hypothetical protein